MYGIMGLKKGGKGKGRHGAHAKYVAGPSAYKTGSRKGTAAGDKGDKKSQARTARELDELIIGGDVTRGGKAFLSGKMSAAERRQQLMDLANRARGKGIPFALNPEEFTGNLRGLSNQAKIGKLRGDMSPSDYHNYMRALHGANPAAMEKAFPWGSGAALRGLANLAVPAPLKMLGSMVGDLGKGAYTAAKKFVPKQIREDVGPGLQKAWGDVKDAPGNLLRDAKGMLTGKLSPVETANLGIIKNEQQNERENLLEGPDTTDDIVSSLAQEILFGTDEGAATETVDASQNIAYDPRRPINYASEASGVPPRKNPFSPGDELDNLLIENELDTRLAETMDVEENIFDPSQDVMPHVPVTMDEKRDAISKGYNWGSEIVAEHPDWLINEYYQDLRGYKEKGLVRSEMGDDPGEGFQGVINQDTWPQWQHPDTAKLVNQINWNTANRPLDWSGGETPELTKDLIEENITTDWDFNQGGYLKKYDDGGYANMSTFEKLKAINDSIAEG